MFLLETKISARRDLHKVKNFSWFAIFLILPPIVLQYLVVLKFYVKLSSLMVYIILLATLDDGLNRQALVEAIKLYFTILRVSLAP